MSLHLIALGVGDAFSALHYSTSLAVEYEGRWLLIDCPHPIRKMLREAGQATKTTLDVDRFDAVLLTHLHADHASGLEGFGYFSRFALQRNAKLYAHPDVLASLWDDHLRAGMCQLVTTPGGAPEPRGIHHYFDVTAMTEETVTEIGPFKVEVRRTKHHIPTTALRITAGRSSLGYSADTAWDPELIKWLAKADLVIHETNHGPAHTPLEKLLGVPAKIRDKLRLVHYPDELDPASSPLPCLEQGKWYRV